MKQIITTTRTYLIDLQEILLPPRARELGKCPLLVAILVLERAAPDFEGLHGDSRSDFSQLYFVVARLDVDVMADLDAVIFVHECYGLEVMLACSMQNKLGTRTLPCSFGLSDPSRGGKRCFNTLSIRFPRFELKPSNIRCG